MSHICDAMVIPCIDFRFQQYIQDFTNKELAGKTFDYVGFTSSIMKQIDISVMKQSILIHHEECEAYGNESTPQRHNQDLKKAKQKVLEAHPNLQKKLYYLKLDGTFKPAEE